MFCPNCGKKVDEGSNFCQYCGFRLVSLEKMPVKEVLRNTLIRRIEGIKHRNPKIIEAVVLKEKYTKFDDWPPFELQESEALSNEAKALKVLKRYEYETRSWKMEIFGDCALVTFMIRYRGTIRDLDFDVRSRVTAFLVKHEGEWKIVHEHWSRLPKPMP